MEVEESNGMTQVLIHAKMEAIDTDQVCTFEKHCQP